MSTDTHTARDTRNTHRVCSGSARETFTLATFSTHTAAVAFALPYGHAVWVETLTAGVWHAVSA